MIHYEQYKRYPKYKESGVEWLGEIPDGWEQTRLGTRFVERRNKVSDKDFEPLSVTKNGILPQLDSAAKSNDGDNRKLVKSGDFVINSRSDRKGSSGIAPQDGSVSLINIVMKPNGINSTFCNYYLKSYSFIEEFYRMGHGIVADLWTTRYDEMKNITIGVPPLSEQTAIATFLDEKIAKIDKAISQKEKLIALLKERKQIMIQNAVTKGLDPNAKMKDSGVEWIGEILEGWFFTKLGHFIDVLSGFAFPSAGFTNDDGIKLLRGINVGIGSVRWDEVVSWPISKIKGLEQYFLQDGDIVFGMDRPLISGGLRIAKIIKEDLPCLLLQRVTRLKGKSTLLQEYLMLILRSKSFMDYFMPILSGVSVPHISPDQIQSFAIGIPPLDVQTEIIDFVTNQSLKIDKAIAVQEKQIDKLKEYKAVLIDSAVTGKIKVC